MLKEFKNISQNEKDVRRRWFEDEYFDLIVWYNIKNEIIGFQLCYGQENFQKAFTWHTGYGYSHDNVDDSRSALNSPQTPILVSDGIIEADSIIGKFLERSRDVDEDIVEMVVNKISDYAGTR